jgi:hypothetical protein
VEAIDGVVDAGLPLETTVEEVRAVETTEGLMRFDEAVGTTVLASETVVEDAHVEVDHRDDVVEAREDILSRSEMVLKRSELILKSAMIERCLYS